MRSLVLLLSLLMSPLAAKTELFLSYDFGLRHYELDAGESVIKVMTPGVRLSLTKEKCNSKTFKSFTKRYSLMLGKNPHLRYKGEPGKKEFKKVLYKIGKDSSVKYIALPQSQIGQHLLRLPEDFAILKRQAIQSCKKTK